MLAGRLTRDPDIRYTTGGRPFARLRVASSRNYRTQASSEWQQEVAYVDVSAWGDIVERMKERLHKGSPVLVEGRLRFREWEAKDGSKRNALEVLARRVQFLESIVSESADVLPAAQGMAGPSGHRQETASGSHSPVAPEEPAVAAGEEDASLEEVAF